MKQFKLRWIIVVVLSIGLCGVMACIDLNEIIEQINGGDLFRPNRAGR
jgi:hypothetical protein